jgi:aryl-alcohol dehydrogenase-like predicted oxidoreductase
MFPRFSAENLPRNLALVDRLRSLAEARSASAAQVAVAWVLAQGEDVVLLIGARRREQLQESLGALELELTGEDLEQIEQAMPAEGVAGDRYGAAQMAALDSER